MLFNQSRARPVMADQSTDAIGAEPLTTLGNELRVV